MSAPRPPQSTAGAPKPAPPPAGTPRSAAAPAQPAAPSTQPAARSAAAQVQPAAKPATPIPPAGPLPPGSKVKLSVTKGLRAGKNYALKEGATYIGRKGPMPIDIDLSEQENPGVAVQMNRFALIWNDANGLGIADTGRNITLVNGVKIPPGKRYPLKADDQIQFGGTVLQVKVIVKKGTGVQK